MLLAILRQFLRALERAHLLLNPITPLNTISLLNNHIATVQISVSLTDVASFTPKSDGNDISPVLCTPRSILDDY